MALGLRLQRRGDAHGALQRFGSAADAEPPLAQAAHNAGGHGDRVRLGNWDVPMGFSNERTHFYGYFQWDFLCFPMSLWFMVPITIVFMGL